MSAKDISTHVLICQMKFRTKIITLVNSASAYGLILILIGLVVLPALDPALLTYYNN